MLYPIHNKESRICTSKAVRWLLIVALSFLPFHMPPAIHAQSNQPLPHHPACDPEISSKSPGLFCVTRNIEFKPGDSNTTVAVRASAEARKKARAAARALATTGSRGPQATLASFSSLVNAVKLYRDNGQCVPFAREYSGVSVSGAARSNRPTSYEPQVGYVLLTNESGPGHVAVVTEVHQNTIKVIERNYYHGWVSVREINRNARFIRGYVAKAS